MFKNVNVLSYFFKRKRKKSSTKLKQIFIFIKTNVCSLILIIETAWVKIKNTYDKTIPNFYYKKIIAYNLCAQSFFII